MKTAIIQLENERIFCLVPETEQEKLQGLIGFDWRNHIEIAKEKFHSRIQSFGMLFLYVPPAVAEMTTFGMWDAIDIVFIANKTVIDIADSITPGMKVSSVRPVEAVIEFPAGFSVAHRIQEGTQIAYLG